MLTPESIVSTFAELGITTPEHLKRVVEAGIGKVRQTKVDETLAAARNKSAVILAASRDAIAPALQQIAEMETEHSQVIARLEALQAQVLADPATNLPDLNAVLAEIE